MNNSQGSATIVLVEDNPGDISLVQLALVGGQFPARMEAFQTVEEARQHLAVREAVPDLLLLDINLTDGNGLDLLAELRRETRYAHVCAAVFSSSASRRDRERAASLGVTRFVEKPADLDEFLSTVGQAVHELLTQPSPCDEDQG